MRTPKSSAIAPPVSRPAPRPVRDGYAWWSTRPLHILVFLAPLVIFYEVGSALYLSRAGEGVVETIRARRLLNDFFEALGGPGLHLPAAALVVTLLIWHFLSRDRWRIDPPTLGLMLLESLAWTAPLLVLNEIVGEALRAAMAAPGAGGAGAMLALAATSAPATDLSARSPMELATIAVGAGLYEELLFRMVLIALLHLVLVDLFRLPRKAGGALSVVLAAAAFALYHEAGRTDWGLLMFYFTAGVFFGAIYVWRGLGIAVATHAAYDLVALLL